MNHHATNTMYDVQSTHPRPAKKYWLQIISGTGWCTILYCYGPLELWFDKSWRLGESELVQETTAV